MQGETRKNKQNQAKIVDIILMVSKNSLCIFLQVKESRMDVSKKGHVAVKKSGQKKY